MAFQIAIAVFGCVGLLQAVLLWKLVRAHRAVTTLEARLGRQADALSLLTETSEAGFALVARELERVATAGTKPARKAPAKRLTTAARRGRSVPEIAAAEGLSEGEVHLRLHLASHGAADGDLAVRG